MSRINTGGYAFPFNELNQYSGDVLAQHTGMTLRDYFAAAALQGILSTSPGAPMTEIVRAAYSCADDMLRVREANNG